MKNGELDRTPFLCLCSLLTYQHHFLFQCGDVEIGLDETEFLESNADLSLFRLGRLLTLSRPQILRCLN